MSYRQLTNGPFDAWGVTEHAIRRILQRRGYARRVALAKLPLTQDVKDLRLEWAEEHVDWGLGNDGGSCGVTRPA